MLYLHNGQCIQPINLLLGHFFCIFTSSNIVLICPTLKWQVRAVSGKSLHCFVHPWGHSCTWRVSCSWRRTVIEFISSCPWATRWQFASYLLSLGVVKCNLFVIWSVVSGNAPRICKLTHIKSLLCLVTFSNRPITKVMHGTCIAMSQVWRLYIINQIIIITQPWSNSIFLHLLTYLLQLFVSSLAIVLISNLYNLIHIVSCLSELFLVVLLEVFGVDVELAKDCSAFIGELQAILCPFKQPVVYFLELLLLRVA